MGIDTNLLHDKNLETMPRRIEMFGDLIDLFKKFGENTNSLDKAEKSFNDFRNFIDEKSKQTGETRDEIIKKASDNFSTLKTEFKTWTN